MKLKVTPEAAVLSVKIWMQIIVGWPPPLNATRKRLIIQNIAWCVAAFFPWHCIPVSILNAMRGPGDAATLTKDLAECLTMVVTLVKMIIGKLQQSRLQIAIADLENFLKSAGPREREMLDRYVNRCWKFYGFVQFLCIITSIAFACGPMVLPQPLPGASEYPFQWRESPKLVAFLYALQVVAVFQVAAGAVVDIQAALLLWYSGIQFELLAEDFKNARSSKEFNKCIKRHQHLVESVNEITIAIRYFAVDVVINTGITNICAGYQFVSDQQPFEVVLQFFFLLCITSLEVLMYAWPADNLLAVSENIAFAAYSAPWIGESREITDGIRIAMMRSQKPIVIAIDGLLPGLNLDFYGKFLSTSFSYFTTLRAVTA